jgi:AcrR family transcriptional regulator
MGGSDTHVDGRRTDTRERIRATALELFTTQGYELTTLAQVADRLAITRPALYHHFRSKEDVLTSSYDELLPRLRDIVTSVESTGASWQARSAALDQFDALIRSEHGALLVCARVNEHAMRGLPAAAVLLRSLDELTNLVAPGTDVDGRMRGRLAMSAIVMAHARERELGGTPSERRRAALDLARGLIRRPEDTP